MNLHFLYGMGLLNFEQSVKVLRNICKERKFQAEIDIIEIMNIHIPFQVREWVN